MATRQDRPTAEEQARRDAEQQRVIGVLHAIVEQDTARLHTGTRPWSWWLDQAARHGRYGFAGTLLIAAQNPHAAKVLSYDDWRAQGRYVTRGQSGIRIVSLRGKPRPVFDVSQTDGEPLLQSRPLTATEAWQVLARLAVGRGYYVGRDAADVPSCTTWEDRRINVAAHLDDTDAVTALAHELGHVLLHREQHTPGSDTAGCHGVRRVEADSIAYLACVHLGLDGSKIRFPSVASWAGSDPRARPLDTIRQVGDRILRAVSPIVAQLHEPRLEETTAAPAVETTTADTAQPEAQTPSSPPTDDLLQALAGAQRFFEDHLATSWVPGYLSKRGFDEAIQRRWRVGYAPATWTALTDQLRALGHSDDAILAAGLAVRSRRGQLIDVFRDRAILPIYAEDGALVAFIGRAADGSKAPKYLNSPETTLYRKGAELFGLHQAREALARGVRPVIVEGPFDAIAVDAACDGQYAPVSPCGTALTAAQLAAVGKAADLQKTGVLVALDGDRAGLAGAVRAYQVLSQVTGPVNAVVFPENQDPADLLRYEGYMAVRNALQSVVPLADLAVDASVERSRGSLEFAEGRLAAVRAAAGVIATMPTDEVARQVRRVADRLGVDHAIVSDAIASAVSPDPGIRESPSRVSALAETDHPRAPRATSNRRRDRDGRASSARATPSRSTRPA